MGRVCRILQHLASVQWGPGRPLGEAQPVLMVLVLLGVLGLELGRWIPGQCGGIAEPLLSQMTEAMVQVTQVLMGTVQKVTVHGVLACGQRPVNSDCYFGSRLFSNVDLDLPSKSGDFNRQGRVPSSWNRSSQQGVLSPCPRASVTEEGRGWDGVQLPVLTPACGSLLMDPVGGGVLSGRCAVPMAAMAVRWPRSCMLCLG